MDMVGWGVEHLTPYVAYKTIGAVFAFFLDTSLSYFIIIVWWWGSFDLFCISGDVDLMPFGIVEENLKKYKNHLK